MLEESGYHYFVAKQNGRQLSGITIASEDNTSDSIGYNYNADGLRTSKTVNGTTTEYYWLEGALLGQRTGDEYLTFLYDENGSAYGFLLRNGTTETIYYYEFNLLGDAGDAMKTLSKQNYSAIIGLWNKTGKGH